MKKRYISLGIVLAMLISMINISAASATAEDFSGKSSFLVKLGVMLADGDISQSTRLRRDRFTKEFAAFINRFSDVDTSQKQNKSYYYDVPLDNEYLPYINFLSEIGYVIGDDGDNFRPDDYITNMEMLKCVVAAVGYTINAKSAQYPDGYLSVASNLKLTKGLGALSAEATVGDMVQLFYNALDVNVMERSISEPDKFEINKDMTYLEKAFKIYWVEGQIDGNYLTTLDGKASVMLEDSISIDGELYSLTEENYYLADYIGYKMRFYYRENNSENEIVAFEEDDTEELVVSSENIKEYTGDKIFYETKDSEKLKKVSLASDAVIMYNGVTLKSYSEDIFTTIPNGSVEFLKVNKGSEYSIVKIYSYETYIIKSVSAESNKIFTKSRRYPKPQIKEEISANKPVEYRYETTAFELDDYKHVFIRNSAGMSVALANLAENNVISVGKSLDGTVIYINVETRAVQGKVTKVYVNENEEKCVELAGEEYILDKNFEANTEFTLTFDISVTAYLSYKGKIAAAVISTGSGEWAYGYMMNMFSDETDDVHMIKIFTASGKTEVFTLREKVSLNGETKKKEEVLKYFKHVPVDGSRDGYQVEPQLIKYQVNAGLVTKIDTADVNYSGNESPETSLTLDMPHNQYQFFWNTKQMVAGGNFDFNNYNTSIRVGDNTLIFYVPDPADKDIGYARARSDESLYSVRVGSGDFVNHQSYKFEVYDIDYNNGGLSSVFVSRAAADERYLDSIVVESVENSIDEDDMPCVIINGYKKGSPARQSYTLKNSTTVFSDFYNNSNSGTKPSSSVIPASVDIFDADKGLRKGDIIRIIEEFGKVKSIRRYYSRRFLEEYNYEYINADEEIKTGTVDMIKNHGVIQADSTFMGTAGAAVDTAMVGIITNYSNGYIAFHNVDPRISKGERPMNDRPIPKNGKIFLNLSGVTVFKYNSKSDKLEIMDTNAINEYLHGVNMKAYAYVQSNATQLEQLVIYEN